jgi:hypothetical protein
MRKNRQKIIRICLLVSSLFIFACSSRLSVYEHSALDASVVSTVFSANQSETPGETELIRNFAQLPPLTETQANLPTPVNHETDRIEPDPVQALFPDDRETYDYFLQFVAKNRNLAGVYHQNFEERFIIRITNEYQYPQHNVSFKITDQNGKTFWRGITLANGEGVIYPNMMFASTPKDLLFLEVEQTNTTHRKAIDITKQGITTLAILKETSPKYLDILFIFDLDGHLKSEFQYLQNTIAQICSRIQANSSSLSLRVGFLTYRETIEGCQINQYDFSGATGEIQVQLNSINYENGSDEPENIQYALQAAVRKVSWKPDALKISLLMADAIPYVDYEQTYTYIDAALEANRRGIKIYTFGAPDTDIVSEYMLRQISALTSGRFIPLSYPATSETEQRGEGQFSTLYQDIQLDDLIVSFTEKEISCQFPLLNITRKASLQ